MKQQISELMDGELSDTEAEQLLRQFDNDVETAENWHVYHLIGDVLRQPELASGGVNQARLQQRLAQEPVLLTRGTKPVNNKRAWVVSVAATVSAFGVVAWMALQLASTGNSPRAAFAADNQQMAPDSSEYMMAHQQFSYGPDMNGGAYYVRSVSYAASAK